jgi:toxin ParE1/3/4
MAGARRPVVWSPEARADLADIWNRYFEVADRRTADRIARRIHEACGLLEQHPLAGRLREELRLGLRSIVARRHVVFYRAVADSIQIVRVIDSRRDLDEIFADRERGSG